MQERRSRREAGAILSPTDYSDDRRVFEGITNHESAPMEVLTNASETPLRDDALRGILSELQLAEDSRQSEAAPEGTEWTEEDSAWMGISDVTRSWDEESKLYSRHWRDVQGQLDAMENAVSVVEAELERVAQGKAEQKANGIEALESQLLGIESELAESLAEPLEQCHSCSG